MNFSSFLDEFLKIAAKVPYMHGTHARFEELAPGVGEAIAAKDPNPRAVYVAGKKRSALPGIGSFAESAAESRGGEPVIAFGKMDTQKGWRPQTLTRWGKEHIGDIDEARDLAKQLDLKGMSKAERGEIWKMLNKGVGAWRNEDLAARLRPKFYKAVRKLIR